MELNATTVIDSKSRPKRTRSDVARALFGFGAPRKSDKLELKDILAILKGYDEELGGINCRVCGKLYKSKVCYTKHLWEHSIYWEQFSGIKNHERVLSIQAAVILWHGYQSSQNGNEENCDRESLHSLLVTSPHKRDVNANVVNAGVAECPKTPAKHPKASTGITSLQKKCIETAVEPGPKTPEKQVEANAVSPVGYQTPLREARQNTVSAPGVQKAKRKLLSASSPFMPPGSDMCSPAKAMRQC